MRWILASERLPGIHTVVKWRNGAGGNIPLGENTFLDQYKKVGPNTSWHEWADETPQPPSTALKEVIKEMEDDLTNEEELNRNHLASTIVEIYMRKLKSIADLPLHDGYWKKRCEAAEYLLNRVDNNINKRFVGYKEWEDLKHERD